jgi:predicted dehydrogenase
VTTGALLGVGVVGLGVGEQHAREFATHPACLLTALCDRDAAKLECVGASAPAARRYTRAEDLIDDPDVAIVVVASNDDEHYAQVVRALRAGKHVFAEKPLCLSFGQLKDIQHAWRDSGGRRLSTNTILRRSARFRWLYDAANNGRLGRIFAIEADYVYGRLHKLSGGWRGRIPNYSVMLGGGIHVADLVLWITGERPTEAFAVGSDLGSQGSGFSGNDLVLALLRFESGLVAKIGANFASVHPHFHRFVVYGTEATFENTISGPARLWTSRVGTDPENYVDASYPGVRKGDLIPAFVNAVLGQGESDVPEPDVFATLSVCLAIDQSAAERRPVRVEYL